jgi:hypothetical protein
MSNHNDDLFDLDPSDDDLAAVEDVQDTDDSTYEDDYLNWDDNVRDDRYADNGIPSWSVWA